MSRPEPSDPRFQFSEFHSRPVDCNAKIRGEKGAYFLGNGCPCLPIAHGRFDCARKSDSIRACVPPHPIPPACMDVSRKNSILDLEDDYLSASAPNQPFRNLSGNRGIRRLLPMPPEISRSNLALQIASLPNIPCEIPGLGNAAHIRFMQP